MPSTSGKINKSSTNKKTTAPTRSSTQTSKRKTATRVTAKKTTPSTTAKKAERKTATSKTPSDRIETLEEKVDKLLSILDTEFRSELRQGPRAISTKLRNAGLIK